MTPDEVRRIRTEAGLSLDGLAKVLRIEDRSTVHRWEKGQRAVSGPASILLELIDARKLPARYFKQAGIDAIRSPVGPPRYR